MNYENYYLVPFEKKQSEDKYLDQLGQLVRIVADGDLISKSDRTELVKIGYVTTSEGYNIITAEGIAYLKDIGKLY